MLIGICLAAKWRATRGGLLSGANRCAPCALRAGGVGLGSVGRCERSEFRRSLIWLLPVVGALLVLHLLRTSFTRPVCADPSQLWAGGMDTSTGNACGHGGLDACGH